METIERLTHRNSIGRIVTYTSNTVYQQNLEGLSILDFVNELTPSPKLPPQEPREKAIAVSESVIGKLEKEFGGEWHVPINGAANHHYVDLYEDGRAAPHDLVSLLTKPEGFDKFFRETLLDLFDGDSVRAHSYWQRTPISEPRIIPEKRTYRKRVVLLSVQEEVSELPEVEVKDKNTWSREQPMRVDAAIIRYPNILVKLSDEAADGFSILARVEKALENGGAGFHEVEAFHREAGAGDYLNLLNTVSKWVAVR